MNIKINPDGFATNNRGEPNTGVVVIRTSYPEEQIAAVVQDLLGHGTVISYNDIDLEGAVGEFLSNRLNILYGNFNSRGFPTRKDMFLGDVIKQWRHYDTSFILVTESSGKVFNFIRPFIGLEVKIP